MPRNMSFMLTTQQMYNRSKTVTRRLGWGFLKPGDIIQAVEKCQGLKKGEKVKKICLIRIINNWPVVLEDIKKIPDEVVLEGFPEMTPDEFIIMFFKSHKGCDRFTTVNRIEFEFI